MNDYVLIMFNVFVCVVSDECLLSRVVVVRGFGAFVVIFAIISGGVLLYLSKFMLVLSKFLWDVVIEVCYVVI